MSGFICMILEVLRSQFRIKSGKTSTWSVETTSHPSNAIPKKQTHTKHRIQLIRKLYIQKIYEFSPKPATPQPAPSSITRLPFSLAGQNFPFLQFFSYNVRKGKTQVKIILATNYFIDSQSCKRNEKRYQILD